MESIVTRLRTTCEDTGGEVQFRESYSGRSMYGHKCVGIVGSMQDCMKMIGSVIVALTQHAFDAAYSYNSEDGDAHDAVYAANDEVQQMQETLVNFSFDSMGLDVIVYWPSIEPEEEEEE